MFSKKISAAILAGGKNKRMGGTNKAFIEVEGTPLIQRTLDVFEPLFEEIFIVTNSPKEYTDYQKDYQVITDKIKNIGPLGGIHSALLQTSKKGVFFVACDMPFLHNDIIKRQISQYDKLNSQALIAKIGNFLEPLHSIYAKELLGKIEQYIKRDSSYSIREFLESVKYELFELDDNEKNRRNFKNLNSPSDL
ncbi:MAG: molybdenum cofactor guanylyltransferase [Candidatus Omnitrophica bacterium]|nr:molybdenum cofactor guanylyltransferase [Candidatus Omnitrophota bacterium]